MNLRVKIDEIKDAGLDLQRELPQAALGAILDAEPPTGFAAAAPATLAVHFDRVNDRDIVARGGFDAAVAADCRRCLAPVRIDLPVKFELDFVNASKVKELAPGRDEDSGEGEIGGTFRPDEADQVAYTGQELDLEPVVREQLLLALPMDALCTEDCKGLCQVCGGNLNESVCSCDRHVPDPRWAGLKDIKLPK
ncbi:YceD family protein [Vulgatibacter sp.]|uniref:YceD family protein n=1 Tax=Vulgatibacter sp. TaxID=1971226 RepID=UPI00356A92AC